MKKILLVTIALLFVTLSTWAQTFSVTVTDQTATAPLANPTPANFQPRYISGFGTDNAFTVFYEDRDASTTISYVQTTSGPTGFPTSPTATVNSATSNPFTQSHFVIKDYPINVGGTDYSYRGWGATDYGSGLDMGFYVSNDLTNWTPVGGFTITRTDPNGLANGTVAYGFHDVILINGTYYAWGETTRGETVIVGSSTGDDQNWTYVASVGSNHNLWGYGGTYGYLVTPAPIAANTGWTPTGNFIDLGSDRGYGKLMASPDDAGFYLAINTAAKASLTPSQFEVEFINPANWTWNDGLTGIAANPILVETTEHDLRECWVVPNTNPNADWNIIYDADFGSGDGGKALGYATLTPPLPPPSELWVDDSYCSSCGNDGHTWGYDAFSTIQEAIDAASSGSVIEVAAGTYDENVVASKRLTIQGAGETTIINGSGGVVLQLAAGGDASNRMIAKDLKVTGGTTGLTAGSYTTLENVISTGNTNYGISLNNLTDLLIASCSFNANNVGMKIGSEVSVSHITITDSHFDNNTTHGWYSDANSSIKPDLDNLSITNTTFNGGNTKGFYTERLSNATFDNITVSNIVNASYVWSAGMDINLKWKSYENITIQNSSFANCGVGSTNGVGLTVKARDDGSTYGANPATLSNVTIDNVTFTGNNNGLNFGEPGKDNNTPTNVVVKNSTFGSNTAMDINNFSKSNIDALTGNTFTGITDNFDIEDRIYHKLDNGLKGLVTWIADNVYVTENSGSVQRGVDAASAGWDVNVAAGTFVEDVEIDKSLTLTGQGPASTTINPALNTNYAITVSKDNVNIQDLTITDPVELKNGIHVVSPAASGLTVDNVHFTNLGVTVGANAYGIHIANSFTGLTVNDCEFESVAAGTSTRQMGVFAPNSLTLNNFDITNCTFTYMWTSIYIRSAINDLNISDNTFGQVESADYTACVAGVYIGDGDDDNFDITNVTVDGNTFTDYGRGVYVWNYGANSTVGPFSITNNTFTDTHWSSTIRFIFGNNGMEYYAVNGITVDNNTFNQSTDVGVKLSLIDFRTYDANLTSCDIDVTNNNLTLSGAPYTDAIDAIRFFAAGGTFYNTTIVGNTLNGGNTGGAGYPGSSGINVYHYSNDPDYTWTHTTAIDVSDNEITGFDNGIAIYDAHNSSYGGLPTGTDLSINENNLSGNALYGIAYGTGETIDATCNWWGSDNVYTIADEVSGDVQFMPFSTSDSPMNCDGVGPVYNTTQALYYTTIQGAIDDADAGDVIEVAAGTYNEAVLVDKYVQLIGAGETSIINSGGSYGIMPKASGLSETERLLIENFKITGSTYGIHISQDELQHLTFENLVVDGCTSTGLQIQGTGTLPAPLDPAIVTDLIIENCKFNNSVTQMGMSVDKYSSIDGLYINNSEFNGNRRGFYSQRLEDSKHGVTNIDNVLIENSKFNNNRERAFYLEKIDNAIFDNIEVTGNGFESDSWNTGLEINLKFAAYNSIIVKNSTFTNNGSGNTQGFGTGINIKARDDGSYAIYPASLATLSIINNVVSGNQRGIGIGEYGKVSNSIASVTVYGNSIVSNTLLGLSNDLTDNVDATCNWWGSDNVYTIADEVSGDVKFMPFSTSDSPMNCDGVGPVYNATQALYYTTIQGAIDDAISGDVIEVAAGTYNEQIYVAHKGIQLHGAGIGQTVLDGTGLTSYTVKFEETDDANNDMWIHGFSFINSPTISIDANMVHNTGTVKVTDNEFDGNSSYAFYAHTSYPTCDIIVNSNTFNSATTTRILLERVEGSVEIGNNTFIDCISYAIYSASYSNTSGDHNVVGKHWFHDNDITGNAGKGIVVESAASWGNPDGGIYSNVEINNNEFDDILDNYNGISLYVSGTNGGIVDAHINSNIITTTAATSTVNGIELNGPVTGTSISGNSLSGFGVGILASAQDIGGTPMYPSGVVAYDNDLSDNLDFGLKNENPTASITATCNYWGSDLSADVAAEVSGLAEFLPYRTVSVSGDCDGVGPVVNTTQTTSYMTIQGAIDAATDGDVIEVAAGNYAENLTINKSISILGAGVDQSIIQNNEALEIGVQNDFTFSGFTIDWQGSSVSGPSMSLTGFGNYDYDVMITNNKFDGGRLYLDHLKQDVLISNNTFELAGIGWDRHLGEMEIANNNIQVYEHGIAIFTWTWWLTGQDFDNYDDLHYIHDNTIDANDGCGILYLSCRDRVGVSSPDKAKFTNLAIENNTISNIGDGWRDAGIALQRIAGQMTSWDYSPLDDNVGFENAIITGNTLTPSSSTAVSPDGIVLAGSTGTSITENSIDGFNNGVDLTGLVGNTVINENSITNNTLDVVNNNAAISIDATDNYWDGCPSVSENVTYYPYYTTVSGDAGSFVFGDQITNITAVSDATDNTICAGSSVTLTAGNGSNFVWEGLGLGTSKVVNPTVTTTYNVTGDDLHGCSGGTASVTITVVDAPTVAISAATVGGTTTLTASGASNYEWNTGDTGSELVVSPTVTTEYTVIGTNDNGCSGSDSYTVNVVSVTIGPDQYINQGSSVTLTATVSGVPSPTYLWSPGGATTDQITVSPVDDTEYTVTVNDTYSASVWVYVNPRPIANAGPDKILVGGSVQLEGSASGGTAPYTYSWTGPSFTSSDQNPLVTAAGTYSLVVTDAYGSSSMADDVEVTAPALNTYTVSGNISYAFNSVNPQMHDVEVTLVGTGGEGTFTGYTAATGDGDYAIAGVPNGIYTVYLNSPKPWGGVTSADVVAIQNHYRARRPRLLQGIKRLAADVVDNSTGIIVNSADRNAVNARRLGNSSSFATGDWVFTRAGDISSTTYPIDYAYTGTTVYSDITIEVNGANLTGQDFKSLCYGDVNASYTGMKDVEIDNSDQDWFALDIYPNPFKQTTNISYYQPIEGQITIQLFDMMGNIVHRFDEVNSIEGDHMLQLNGSNLRAGIYVYVMTLVTDDDVIRQTSRIVITK